MEAMDKDHNKYIDYQEFIAAASDHQKLTSQANLEAAFKLFDRDGSGKLSADELRSVFDTSGTRKDQSLWQEIMREVDRDGDGVISFQEFSEVMGIQVRRRVSTRVQRQLSLREGHRDTQFESRSLIL